MKKVKKLKAKIKLKLKDKYNCPELRMYIKLEDEKFYYHNFKVIYCGWNKFKTPEQFNNELYDFLSDKNFIIKYAEVKVKNILEEKLKNIDIYSKEKELKKLLKQLKQPIEIEVKE